MHVLSQGSAGDTGLASRAKWGDNAPDPQGLPPGASPNGVRFVHGIGRECPMAKQVVKSDKLYPVYGPYSHAVRAEDMVFLHGTVGVDAHGRRARQHCRTH